MKRDSDRSGDSDTGTEQLRENARDTEIMPPHSLGVGGLHEDPLENTDD